MHCRFFRQHLGDCYENITSGSTTLTHPLQKIKDSLQFMNDCFQLIGNVLPQATTKFSVKGDEGFSMVHFNFPHGKCYAKCQNSMCAARLSNKKKITKELPLAERSLFCSHLHTVYECLDQVKAYFPMFFEEEPTGDEANPAEDVNADDADLEANLKGNFNLETGLWEYKALSQHKPLMMLDPQLNANTQDRNQATVNIDTSQEMDLKPEFLQEDGSPRLCACGSNYGQSPSYILKTTATLYTRMGPVQCNCFDLKCTAGTCEVSFLEVAAARGIFFYSNKTCAGNEIGWDFISRVTRSKLSFTSFCQDMTRIYQTNNVMSSPFMSVPTIVK